MFREIKKQITLFNILILIVFLVFFIALLMFMWRWTYVNFSERFLVQTAQNIINSEKYETRKNTNYDGRASNYEFILWDGDHHSEHMKVFNDSLILRGHELLQDTKFNKTFRTFETNHITYRVYSKRFKKDNEVKTLQVFQQISNEQNFTQTVFVILLFFGSAGILILIPISYFLAGKSLQPVKTSYENQKKFIADASHELRTPLTVIQTNIEVLRMKEDEVLSENIHWLNNIASESETMSKLISNLLTIAQADNNRLVFNKKVFDLSALCAEVYDLMFDFANQQEITLRSDIQQDIEYKGDEDKLKQAIRILVDNAIKYTIAPGTVTIRLTASMRSIQIAVIDTGIGLSSEDKKKIFERFYRVDDARHREQGGFGLGLNICNLIVKQHGGKITIDSELGKGSTFTITLPKYSL